MDKSLNIRLHEKTIEELNKQLIMLKEWLKMYQDNNDEEYIKKYENLIIECKELTNKYNNKLCELKGGEN